MDFFESPILSKNNVSVEKNVSLAKYTTMRVGGPADYFVEPRDEKTLICVLRAARECGVPPLQYQLGIRLARAKNLLRSSDMPISEIAESLGFNSTWYFSHFFKKQTGTSPAAYRR